ncbi:MAG: GNAT family N-acetyltransferase [bacterium]|nr:GNAT family N-acetyltransferase [bacterium]
MKKCDCPLCKFNNPRPCNAVIIIKDGKLLLAKRNKDPYKGQWDFFGGYVDAGENLEESLKREVYEELGVKSESTYIGSFSGTASYGEYKYPVLNIAYLVDIKGKIKLDKKENSELAWVPIQEVKTIAFDSNKKILEFIKEKFTYNWEDVKKLIGQLDSSATVNEQSFYKAIFNGYVSKIEKNGRLLGMGWIFPRQTAIRCQAVVEDMIVDESQRGKGLGEKILKDLISWSKKQGVEVIELTTNPKRLAANALYQKIGFKLHKTNHYLLDLK